MLELYEPQQPQDPLVWKQAEVRQAVDYCYYHLKQGIPST